MDSDEIIENTGIKRD